MMRSAQRLYLVNDRAKERPAGLLASDAGKRMLHLGGKVVSVVKYEFPLHFTVHSLRVFEAD